MQRIKPLIILFLVLGSPLLFLLLLDSGVHHRNTLGFQSPLISNPDGSPDSIYKAIGNFDFQDQNDVAISKDSITGFITVANIFYTGCQEACYEVNRGMFTVQEYFQDIPEVKLLSFTVNPKVDDVETLNRYAESFSAIDHKWYMLTGDKQELHHYIMDDLYFHLAEDSNAVHPYDLDHTIRIIDKDGRVRGNNYDGSDVGQVDSLIAAIKVLQYEYVEE